jgi:Helix-turn-helix domain
LSRDFSGTPDDWISQAEAARLRGISRQAVASLIKTKRVETLTIGGRVFVRRQDIEQFQPKKAGRKPTRKRR